MNIRIISGLFRGRVIEGSGTRRTHPMGSRVRNAMFNKLAGDIKGAVVLDAFAGSGAVGFEALSRGAERVVFVEKDRVAQRIIQKNIDTLGVGDRAVLVRAPVKSWRKTTDESFDVIFADPPYYDLQLSTVFGLKGLLRPEGLMVLSYPGSGEVPTELGVVVVDNRSYGNAALAFYRLDR